MIASAVRRLCGIGNHTVFTSCRKQSTTLLELLEQMGAVGPDEGGGRSREVLTRREAVED